MITEKELSQQLKGQLSNLYYLHGTEQFLIDQYKKLITKKFLKNSDNQGEYMVMDFERLNLSDLSDTLLGVGFFSAKKMVCINDFDFGKLNKNDAEFFLEIIDELAEDNLLLIACKSKVQNSTAFFKKMDNMGISVQLNHRTTNETIKFMIKIAEKNATIIDKSVCQYLIEIVRNDMQLLENEMEKLVSYKKNGIILKTDIDSLVGRSVEQSTFLLLDLILKFDVKLAMALLQDLFYEGQEPLAILAALSMGLTDIYRYKLAKEGQIDDKELIASFSYKPNDFRVKKASWNEKKITVLALEQMFLELYETDKKMKTTSVDSKILLECCVISIFKIYKERK